MTHSPSDKPLEPQLDAADESARKNSPPPPPDPSDHDAVARHWLKHVYVGDRVRQLSFRAVLTGMLIGGVMSISNLYVGLKSGWGLGVTITACIIAYAVFKFLEAIFPPLRRNEFTILENYTMSSAASAAGYMASAGLVSAIPALTLVTGRQLLWWEIMAWLAAVSFLGVFMAIPLKRQLINIDQLPFPSGIATAETLKSMHTAGREAILKGRALIVSALAGVGLAIWRDGFADFGGKWAKEGEASGRQELGQWLEQNAFPAEFPLLPASLASGPAQPAVDGVTPSTTSLAQEWLEKYTIGIEGSFIMVAAGAIMGIRVGCSLMLGTILYYGILAPVLVDRGIVPTGYRGIVSWTLWPATALMVTSGLLSFAFKWRTVLRAFSGLTSLGDSRSRSSDPLAAIEVPGWWFLAGTLVSGAACVILGEVLFESPFYMGILAVLLTFLLSIVAARATGETDITPIGAMGKITQLTFGVVAPSNPTTNLMTAAITSGAASHSADLLTDLKSGYLLGGNPRKQTISQLFGVIAGTLVCVPVYMVIADPAKLGTKELPAPAAKVWEGVAKMLSEGLDKLPAYSLQAMLLAAGIGAVLAVLEEVVPRKYRWLIPSPTGLGIAGVVPAFNSISMFIGALLAWLLSKSHPKVDEQYTVPVSSGLIAGESLTGVFLKLTLAGPQLLKSLFPTG
ncbi:MAG: OPT family oligopeptide transporter [Planctomycetaceae bacterium]